MTARAKLSSSGFKYEVSTSAYIPYTNAPVARGVSIPEGELREVDSVQATDAWGRPHPVQASPLGRWSDGSVKWALIELPADVPASPLPRPRRALEGATPGSPHAVARYKVLFGHKSRQKKGDVVCRETLDAIEVSNSRLRIRFDRQRFSIFNSVQLDGRSLVHPDGMSDIIVEDEKGKQYFASLARSPSRTRESGGST